MQWTRSCTAKRFFRKMLQDEPLLSPDRIGTDGAGSYPPAIAESRKAGLLARTPVHYVTKHLQQGIESDHFRVKRPMPRVGCFQAFPRPGAPSRASRRCCDCARASALRAPGRCASRTGYSRSASVFQRLTKCEIEARSRPFCGLRQSLRHARGVLGNNQAAGRAWQLGKAGHRGFDVGDAGIARSDARGSDHRGCSESRASKGQEVTARGDHGGSAHGPLRGHGGVHNLADDCWFVYCRDQHHRPGRGICRTWLSGRSC